MKPNPIQGNSHQNQSTSSISNQNIPFEEYYFQLNNVNPLNIPSSVPFQPKWKNISNQRVEIDSNSKTVPNQDEECQKYEEQFLKSLQNLEQIERRVRFEIETRVSNNVPSDLIRVLNLNESYDLDSYERKLIRNYIWRPADLHYPDNWKEHRIWDRPENSETMKRLQQLYQPTKKKKTDSD